MTLPVNGSSAHRPLTTAEQDALSTASISREQCVCGETHADNDTVTPATIARMKAYSVEHPDHQFVVDDEARIVAVVIAPALNGSGPLQVVAKANDLIQLLDDIGAPRSESLS